MRIVLSFEYDGIEAGSPQAEEILSLHFGRYDLRRMAQETGARVILEDVFSDTEAV